MPSTSFHSLQTGMRIQSFRSTPKQKSKQAVFPFPSNGKVYTKTDEEREFWMGK